MITQAGQLDRRIEFYRQSSDVDNFGQDVGAFTSTGISVWAKVIDKSGSESEESNQIVAVSNVNFLIRYNSSILETWRILYRSKYYRIEAIIEDESRDSFMRIETRISD